MEECRWRAWAVAAMTAWALSMAPAAMAQTPAGPEGVASDSASAEDAAAEPAPVAGETTTVETETVETETVETVEAVEAVEAEAPTETETVVVVEETSEVLTDAHANQTTTTAAAERVLTTAGEAELPPSFQIWSDPRYGFIKPIVHMSAGVVSYFPRSGTNDELQSYRISTILLARLGFEGQLFDFLTFRTLFERNIGFTLARGGPIGTSIWEGSGSFQARENYLRLSKWGLSLVGGIFPDPATVDYITTASLDLFGMDPYVRDPLLVSGFNQGQGMMLSYNWRWLTAGFSFSAGNPLTSSLSFGFGGNVSALGSLFSAPLRALSNGVPGSDIQMYVFTPSFMFESDWFDIKLAAQFYEVDLDLNSSDDRHLSGYNLRATMQGKFFGARIFATGAIRRNGQIALPDVTMVQQDFEGAVLAAGAEYVWQNLVIGGQYYWVQQTTTPPTPPDRSDLQRITTQYVTFGASYFLRAPNVAIGLRYSRNWLQDAARERMMTPLPLEGTDSLIFTMRLVI